MTGKNQRYEIGLKKWKIEKNPKILPSSLLLDGAGGRGNVEKSHLDSLLTVIRNIYISARDNFLIVFRMSKLWKQIKNIVLFQICHPVAKSGTGSCRILFFC